MPTSSTPNCRRSSRPDPFASIHSNHRRNHMRLVIIGAGFAGMYAALSAARLRDIKGASPEKLEIALVSPQPTLVVRPRLYEPKPETLTAPLLDVLKAIDVVYVQGSAETVDTKAREVGICDVRGKAKEALLRSPGRGHRQPAVPSEHSRPRRARLQRRLARRCDRARPASAWPGRSAGCERTRHGRRCRRRLHRHRGGNRDAVAAARQSRQRRQAARHHRRAQQMRSLPTWAKVRVPSSRTR